MPSINVQELYERFMEDPDYIGKEALALAEAKQRAIQTMNNHKALSMAKAITPMEELLEFLIKKSVLQKAEGSHWSNQYPSRGVDNRGRPQFDRTKLIRHLVTPKDGGGTSHQELLDHIKGEIERLLGDDVSWDELANQESQTAAFAKLKETGFIDRFAPILERFKDEAPEGKVQGIDALNLLSEREDKTAVSEEEDSLVDELKSLVADFNVGQRTLQETLSGDASQKAKEELIGEAQGISQRTLLDTSAAWQKPEKSPVADHNEWMQTFRDVVNRTLLDSINPQNWRHDAHYITEGDDRPLTPEERKAANDQSEVRNLVMKLTGEDPLAETGEVGEDGSPVHQPSARAAYDLLDTISKHPDSFLRQQNGKPMFTNVDGSYYSTSAMGTPQIETSRLDQERSRDNTLLDLVEHVQKIIDSPNRFDKPEGEDSLQHHGVSPTAQWKLDNAFGDDTRTNELYRRVAVEHQPDEPIDHVIDRIAEEMGASFPENVPGEVLEEQAAWDSDIGSGQKQAMTSVPNVPQEEPLQDRLNGMNIEDVIQEWHESQSEAERTGNPPTISNKDLEEVFEQRSLPLPFSDVASRSSFGHIIDPKTGKPAEYGDRLSQETLRGWARGGAVEPGEGRSVAARTSSYLDQMSGSGETGAIYDVDAVPAGLPGNETGAGEPIYTTGGQVTGTDEGALDIEGNPTQIQVEETEGMRAGRAEIEDGGDVSTSDARRPKTGSIDITGLHSPDEQPQKIEAWSVWNSIRRDRQTRLLRPYNSEFDEKSTVEYGFGENKRVYPNNLQGYATDMRMPPVPKQTGTPTIGLRPPGPQRFGGTPSRGELSETGAPPLEGTKGIQDWGNISGMADPLYSNEDTLSFVTRNGHTSYMNTYRDVMTHLINGGFDIDDFTQTNLHGQRIWSEATMVAGLQHYGLLNWDEDNKTRPLKYSNGDLALTKAKGEPSNLTKGIAPLVPGRERHYIHGNDSTSPKGTGTVNAPKGSTGNWETTGHWVKVTRPTGSKEKSTAGFEEVNHPTVAILQRHVKNIVAKAIRQAQSGDDRLFRSLQALNPSRTSKTVEEALEEGLMRVLANAKRAWTEAHPTGFQRTFNPKTSDSLTFHEKKLAAEKESLSQLLETGTALREQMDLTAENPEEYEKASAKMKVYTEMYRSLQESVKTRGEHIEDLKAGRSIPYYEIQRKDDGSPVIDYSQGVGAPFHRWGKDPETGWNDYGKTQDPNHIAVPTSKPLSGPKAERRTSRTSDTDAFFLSKPYMPADFLKAKVSTIVKASSLNPSLRREFFRDLAAHDPNEQIQSWHTLAEMEALGLERATDPESGAFIGRGLRSSFESREGQWRQTPPADQTDSTRLRFASRRGVGNAFHGERLNNPNVVYFERLLDRLMKQQEHNDIAAGVVESMPSIDPEEFAKHGWRAIDDARRSAEDAKDPAVNPLWPRFEALPTKRWVTNPQLPGGGRYEIDSLQTPRAGSEASRITMDNMFAPKQVWVQEGETRLGPDGKVIQGAGHYQDDPDGGYAMVGREIWDKHGRRHRIEELEPGTDSEGVFTGKIILSRLDAEGEPMEHPHEIEVMNDPKTGTTHPIKIVHRALPGAFAANTEEEDLDNHDREQADAEELIDNDMSPLFTSNPQRNSRRILSDHNSESEMLRREQYYEAVVNGQSKYLGGTYRDSMVRQFRQDTVGQLAGRSLDWVDIIEHFLNKGLAPNAIPQPYEMFGTGFHPTNEEFDRFERLPQIAAAGIKRMHPPEQALHTTEQQRVGVPRLGLGEWDPETQQWSGTPPSDSWKRLHPAEVLRWGTDAPELGAALTDMKQRLRAGRGLPSVQELSGEEADSRARTISILTNIVNGSRPAPQEVIDSATRVLGRLIPNEDAPAYGLQDLLRPIHIKLNEEQAAKYASMQERRAAEARGEGLTDDLEVFEKQVAEAPDPIEDEQTVRDAARRDGRNLPPAAVEAAARLDPDHLAEIQKEFDNYHKVYNAIMDHGVDLSKFNEEQRVAYEVLQGKHGSEGLTHILNDMHSKIIEENNEDFVSASATRVPTGKPVADLAAKVAETPVVPKVDVAKLDAHPFSTVGAFTRGLDTRQDMRVLSEDERNALLGRTSIGGGQSIFSDDLPVGFGNRQHIAAMNAMTLHDKAVADGYEGATPELEHFNADGSKRGGVGLYAHEKQPTYYNNPAPEGVHHPNYWAMHLYDQFHRGMPKDAEHISEAQYNDMRDSFTEQYGVENPTYRTGPTKAEALKYYHRDNMNNRAALAAKEREEAAPAEAPVEETPEYPAEGTPEYEEMRRESQEEGPVEQDFPEDPDVFDDDPNEAEARQQEELERQRAEEAAGGDGEPPEDLSRKVNVRRFPKGTPLSALNDEEDGINVLRPRGGSPQEASGEHFGNPFNFADRRKSSAPYTVRTVQEATELYKDWILGNDDRTFTGNDGVTHKIGDLDNNTVLKAQREFIRRSLSDGVFFDKDILYHTDEHEKANEPDHAGILQELQENWGMDTTGGDQLNIGMEHRDNVGKSEPASLYQTIKIDGKQIQFSHMINGPSNRRMVVALVDGKRVGFMDSSRSTRPEGWVPMDSFQGSEPEVGAQHSGFYNRVLPDPEKPDQKVFPDNHIYAKIREALIQADKDGNLPTASQLAEAGHGSEDAISPEIQGRQAHWDHDGSSFSPLDVNRWLGTTESKEVIADLNTKYKDDPNHPDVVWNLGLMNNTKAKREGGQYGDAPPIAEAEAVEDALPNGTEEPAPTAEPEPAAPSTETDDLGLGEDGAEAQEVYDHIKDWPLTEDVQRGDMFTYPANQMVNFDYRPPRGRNVDPTTQVGDSRYGDWTQENATLHANIMEKFDALPLEYKARIYEQRQARHKDNPAMHQPYDPTKEVNTTTLPDYIKTLRATTGEPEPEARPEEDKAAPTGTGASGPAWDETEQPEDAAPAAEEAVAQPDAVEQGTKDLLTSRGEVGNRESPMMQFFSQFYEKKEYKPVAGEEKTPEEGTYWHLRHEFDSAGVPAEVFDSGLTQNHITDILRKLIGENHSDADLMKATIEELEDPLYTSIAFGSMKEGDSGAGYKEQRNNNINSIIGALRTVQEGKMGTARLGYIKGSDAEKVGDPYITEDNLNQIIGNVMPQLKWPWGLDVEALLAADNIDDKISILEQHLAEDPRVVQKRLFDTNEERGPREQVTAEPQYVIKNKNGDVVRSTSDWSISPEQKTEATVAPPSIVVPPVTTEATSTDEVDVPPVAPEVQTGDGGADIPLTPGDGIDLTSPEEGKEPLQAGEGFALPQVEPREDVSASAGWGLIRHLPSDDHIFNPKNWEQDVPPGQQQQVARDLQSLLQPGVMRSLNITPEHIIAHIKNSGIRGTGKNLRNAGVDELAKKVNSYYSTIQPKLIGQKRDMELTDTRSSDWNEIEGDGSLQEQLDKRKESGDNTPISPHEATQFARRLVAYQSRILNAGIDLSGSTAKYKDLKDKVDYTNQLIYQAAHTFGADMDLIESEVQEHGQGPDIMAPHGTSEFLEEAEQKDSERAAQREHFDRITAQNSPEMHNAWEDMRSAPVFHEYSTEATGRGDSREQVQGAHDMITGQIQSDLQHHRTGLDTHSPERKTYLEGKIASSKEQADSATDRLQQSQTAVDALPPLGYSKRPLERKILEDTLQRAKDEQEQTQSTLRGYQSDLDSHTTMAEHHQGNHDRLQSELTAHQAKSPDLTEFPEIETQAHDHVSATYQRPVREQKNSTQYIDTVGDAEDSVERHFGARYGGQGEHKDSSEVDYHPIPVGLPEDLAAEYRDLHNDIANHRLDVDAEGGDKPHEAMTGGLKARKTALGDKLTAKGFVDSTGASPVDHPEFGQHTIHHEGVHPSNRSALTSAPPTNSDGQQLHKLDGVGWVHKPTIDSFREQLGHDEGIFHPGGLVHNDDGTASDKGLYMDRTGVHGVAPVRSDGNYSSQNVGTLTNQDLRQHDLGRALNRGIMGDGTTGVPHSKVQLGRTTIASGSDLGRSQHGKPHYKIKDATSTLHELGATKPSSGTQNQTGMGTIPTETKSHTAPSAGTKGRPAAPITSAPPSGGRSRISQAVQSFHEGATAPGMLGREAGKALSGLDPRTSSAPAPTPTPKSGPSMPSLEKSKDAKHSIEELLKFLEKEKVK